MPKIERKYLAHFLDAKFGVKTQGEEPELYPSRQGP